MSKDEQFERKVKASLDANIGTLDADTRRRLADIRKQALINSQSQRFAWLNPSNYLPAGALALCSVFAVFLVFSPQNKDVQILQNDQLAVFELLNNPDDLEVMTDPDFYAWIDEDLIEINADGDV
jgi:hypothetical protein